MALGIISLSYNVNKLLQKKEALRILRENVMLIVRDYNNIKMTISDDQTKLFAEHLQYLENQIAPGIKKFNWGSNAEFFVQSTRKECKLVYSKVKQFQNNVDKIYSEFDKIGKTNLTDVQKVLYLLPDFIKK
jgi:dynein heavy chain